MNPQVEDVPLLVPPSEEPPRTQRFDQHLIAVDHVGDRADAERGQHLIDVLLIRLPGFYAAGVRQRRQKLEVRFFVAVGRVLGCGHFAVLVGNQLLFVVFRCKLKRG